MTKYLENFPFNMLNLDKIISIIFQNQIHNFSSFLHIYVHIYILYYIYTHVYVHAYICTHTCVHILYYDREKKTQIQNRKEALGKACFLKQSSFNYCNQIDNLFILITITLESINQSSISMWITSLSFYLFSLEPSLGSESLEVGWPERPAAGL